MFFDTEKKDIDNNISNKRHYVVPELCVKRLKDHVQSGPNTGDGLGGS